MCTRAPGTIQHHGPLNVLSWLRHEEVGSRGDVGLEKGKMRSKSRAVLSGGSVQLVMRKNSFLVRVTQQSRLSRRDEPPITRGVQPPARLLVQSQGCTTSLSRSLLHSDAVTQCPPTSHPCGTLSPLRIRSHPDSCHHL